MLKDYDPLRFDATIISEAFPGGANPAEADLTPRAIKSGMRFWFRAMMGRVVGNDILKLKQLERLTFGSANDEDNETGSPFRIRLLEIKDEDEHIVFPSPETYSTRGNSGYNYLSFPFRVSDNTKGRESVIGINSSFRIKIEILRIQNPKYKQILRECMWLFVQFGGIGTRSRRTFGGITIEKNGDYAFTEKNLVKQFKRRLNLIEKCFFEYAEIEPLQTNTKTSFLSFSQWEGRIIINPQWIEISQLQDDMGKFLRLFRNGKIAGKNSLASVDFKDVSSPTKDYDQAIRDFMLGPKTTIDDPLINNALGLPIIYFDKKTGQTTQVGWGDSGAGRLASPLVIRPIKLDRGFAALIAFFSIVNRDECISVVSDSKTDAVIPPQDDSVDNLKKFLFDSIDKIYQKRGNRDTDSLALGSDLTQ